MRDNCYIDGVSIWSRFGVWVTKGGYNNLLTFPALKEPVTNDWPEEDGIEVDLENPTLEAKEVTVTFCASKPGMEAADFIVFISQPGYHTLRVADLGREWRLRLMTQTANKVYPAASAFSLKFADDFPGRTSVYPPASGGGAMIPVSDYELDGTPLSQYGIVVESGRDELLKSPTVKQNLSRTFSTSDGRIYDADRVVFNSKEVTLKCCLNTVSMAKFWECYTAFFNDLIKPGERSLYWDYTSESYPCYYKKSSGFKVITLSRRVVVEFDLTLVLTVFRVGETEYLLAAEFGDWIMTEDGKLIDMK